jgi:hypothetical protein
VVKAPSILAVALVAALAGPATALPLFFTGPSNYGTSQAEVNSSISMDPAIGLLDLDATQFDFSLAGGASLPNPTCADAPGDPSCLDLTVVLPPSVSVDLSPNPSPSDPTRATSAWQITNTSGFALDVAYLVFVTSFGALSGDPALVGIDPVGSQNYSVIGFDAGVLGRINYAAIALGAMGIGATREISVNYAIADELIPGEDMNLLLPVLNIQAVVSPAIIPEPGTFSLFALGVLGLAAKRRRTCT